MVIFMMTFIKQHSCDDFACENELFCRYYGEHGKAHMKQLRKRSVFFDFAFLTISLRSYTFDNESTYKRETFFVYFCHAKGS
jgi:hypothetical protein